MSCHKRQSFVFTTWQWSKVNGTYRSVIAHNEQPPLNCFKLLCNNDQHFTRLWILQGSNGLNPLKSSSDDFQSLWACMINCESGSSNLTHSCSRLELCTCDDSLCNINRRCNGAWNFSISVNERCDLWKLILGKNCFRLNVRVKCQGFVSCTFLLSLAMVKSCLGVTLYSV